MRARTAVLALATVLLVAAGCDVPTNDEPVALSGPFATLETTTTISTTEPQDDARDVVVWVLRTQGGATVLQDVVRRVALDAGIQEVLRALFTQPPGDDRPGEQGLSSAIPSSATLLSAERSAVDEDRLIVDVRGLFGDEGVQGPTLRNALAQIVWTATEATTGYREVVFRNDGQPADALVDELETTGEAVSRDDYQQRVD